MFDVRKMPPHVHQIMDPFNKTSMTKSILFVRNFWLFLDMPCSEVSYGRPFPLAYFLADFGAKWTIALHPWRRPNNSNNSKWRKTTFSSYGGRRIGNFNSSRSFRKCQKKRQASCKTPTTYPCYVLFDLGWKPPGNYTTAVRKSAIRHLHRLLHTSYRL